MSRRPEDPLSGARQQARWPGRSTRQRVSVAAAVPILAFLLIGIGAPTAAADSGDVGYQDQSFSGTSEPTGTKRAESVL